MRAHYLAAFAIIALAVLLSACDLSMELSGAAGGDQGQGQGQGNQGGSQGGGQGQGNEGGMPGSQGVAFSIPTIRVTIGQGDGVLVTNSQLSIPSMGTGELELSYPGKMKQENSASVQLVIVPPSVEIDKPEETPTPSQTLNPLQIFQDGIEVYPFMRARLTGGDAVGIELDGQSDRAVTSTSPAEWYWTIKPSKAGMQTLRLSISVPVEVDNQPSEYGLKSIRLEISVEELPTPTPSPTPTPTATPTSTPEAWTVLMCPMVSGTEITGSAVLDFWATVLAALLGFAGVAVTAFVALRGEKKKREMQKEQREQESTKRQQQGEEIKANLPTKKMARRKTGNTQTDDNTTIE